MLSNKTKAPKPMAPKTVRNCQHIKVTGVPCGGPAMRGELFCYFHQRMLRGVKVPPNVRIHPIALVEDEESIQASLMEVINALARNHIDMRRADLILKALNIAVKNCRKAKFISDSRMVREVPDYPAPPKPAPPPVPEDQVIMQRNADNALLQIRARALATIPVPAAAAPAPVLVASANTKPTATSPTAAGIATEVDPTQRKPPARAGMPASTQVAVNHHKRRT
ncbi:MAG TPA: hypothetical protein VI386_18655 [Candidatus Sulfotelmatobacter sp.]